MPRKKIIGALTRMTPLLCPLLLIGLRSEQARANEIRVLESSPSYLIIDGVFSNYRWQPLQETAGDYALLIAPGCGYSHEAGRPMVPMAGFLVGLPPQGQPSVVVLQEDWETVSAEVLCPVPSPSEELPSQNSPPVWNLLADRSIYDRDAFYPSSLAKTEILGQFRDQRIARIQISPFRFNPVRRQLQVCRHLVLKVDFPSPDLSPRDPSTALPHSREIEQTLSPTLLNYETARAWRLPRRETITMQPSKGTETASRCRIVISQDGIYSIGQGELLEAGLELESIDPRTFQLSCKGFSVPIYVTGEKDGSLDPGDMIEFFGEANKGTFLSQHEDMFQDPYDTRNVYWLSWGTGSGARLVEEDAGIRTVGARKPRSYNLTIHAEEDRYRDHLNKQQDIRDHWFWDSGIGAQGMKTYPLELPHPDRNSPSRPVVRVMLHGLTSVEEAEPDHHVLIYLNDHLVADQIWDGQDKLLVDSSREPFEITSSAVGEEENTLTLICPGDTEAGAIDRILLNWIEVDYPKFYLSAEDQLEFRKPRGDPRGLYQFTIGGFSSPSVRIYKLGSSVMTNAQGEWIQEENGEVHYRVTFQDEILDEQIRYLAVSTKAKKKVSSIELRPAPALTNGSRGADVVMVVHDDFLEHILPLAEHRRSQGLQVEVVPVSEIYDQFSHGLFTPLAIRDFLRYTYQNWNPAPVYVLLVGDGNWDYKNTLGPSRNYIPPIMTQTSNWGETPCDNLYACVSGDDLIPDLFIGRLPVQTNRELDAIVAKIISTESAPELGDWRRRLLFICGSGDYGNLFRSQSENLIRDHVTSNFLVSRVYAHSANPATDPYFGGTQDLIDALDEGVSFVNYIGHGGGGIWSDAGLMRLEDVERLRNGSRWPMVASLTCFTAAFDEPKRASLGERLLLVENQGVVGFWGASGVGWLYGDYNLDNELMEIIFSGADQIFGQAVTRAKLQYLATYGGQIAQDLVNEYILLGDPASRIGFPLQTIHMTAHPEAINPGDVLQIQGSLETGTSGQVRVTVLDENESVLWESTAPISAGRFETSAAVPVEAQPGQGTVRCYYWNPETMEDGSGRLSFSLGQAFFDTVYTDPAWPAESQTVHVWAQISTARGIDSVRCRWKVGVLDSTIAMIPQSVPGQYRTAGPIPPFPKGSTVRYWVSVLDSTGLSTSSTQMSYHIPSAPDLQISPENISLAAQDGVGIAITVINLGETQADSVLVRVDLTPPQKQHEIKEGIIPSVAPAARNSLFIPWDLPSGTYAVQALVDPENSIDEGNENNNEVQEQISVELFNITPQEGSMTAGLHAPVFSLDGDFGCEIPPGAVGSRQIMNIRSTTPRVENQPDLEPARLASGTKLAYQLALIDSTASLESGAGITLIFRLDGQDSLNTISSDKMAVYRWNETIDRWIRHSGITWMALDSISAEVSALGQYCPMINGDDDPPSIEVTVEEQHYTQGALVSRDARIVALVQDVNGVDSQEHPVEIRHNGQVVAEGAFTINPSAERNSLPVSYSPKLSTGRHTISFSAYDCSGNLASKTMDFQVIDAYGIDHIGNYPNPMDEETAFTYRLTGPSHADEISLKIYTVSGRLIRTFKNFLDEFGQPGTQLDHHVVTWDGRDGDGNPLANGVYFYKIRAKWEDRTVQETGKLAILR